MKMLFKGYSVFQRIVIYVCLMLFVLIGFGTVYNMSSVSFSDEMSGALTLIIGVFVSIVLLLFVFLNYKLIDRWKGQKGVQYTYAFLSFVVMILVFSIMLVSFDVKPMTDSFDDIDTAYYLVHNPKITTDNSHIETLSVYSNNYFFIICLKYLFVLFSKIGVHNVLPPLYLLNVIAIIFSVLLTWLIVKNIFSVERANKVLVLCVLNPVYYGLTFWVYSCTLSLPFAMGIIYVAVKIYKANKLCKAILLAIIEGILVFAGYQIRPTAVFGFIAIVLCSVVIVINANIVKKVLVSFLVLVITCTSLLVCYNVVKDKYFGEITDYNYPIYNWLLMGSHGNGDLTTYDEDKDFIKSFDDVEKRNEALKDKTIENYKENGISGTLFLWCRKTITTWSDGYNPRGRISYGEQKNTVHEYLEGSNKEFYQIYCHAFRLITILGIIILCIVSIRRKKVPSLYFIILLTLFGAMLFYMIWEAKNVYSAPFILMMLIVSQYGLEVLKENSAVINNQNSIRTYFVVYCTVAVLIAVICTGDFKTVSTHNYYRINSIISDRINTAIEVDNDESITQDFYVDDPFSGISLLASCDDADSADISPYIITLSDSNGNVLLKRTITSRNIIADRINLRFNDINIDNHYYINIIKKDADKKNIYFYTKNTYYLDSYDGKLSVGENHDFTNDLMMNVYYSESVPYLDMKTALIITISFVVVSILVFMGSFPCVLKRKIKTA